MNPLDDVYKYDGATSFFKIYYESQKMLLNSEDKLFTSVNINDLQSILKFLKRENKAIENCEYHEYDKDDEESSLSEELQKRKALRKNVFPGKN